MNIRQVTDGKEDYIELLRMGDPDESRIRKVLEEGELFLLEEHGKLAMVSQGLISAWSFIVRGYIFGRKEM